MRNFVEIFTKIILTATKRNITFATHNRIDITMKNLEFDIASRTSAYDKNSRAAVMMRIAAITVALGIAVMIITLAVFTGFRRQIQSDLRGLVADIQIADMVNYSKGEAAPIVFSADFNDVLHDCTDVDWAAPYIAVNCMIKNRDNTHGLQIKGIDSLYHTEWWQEHLVEGVIPDFTAKNRGKQIVVSNTTARLLSLNVGDKVEVLYMGEGSTPHRDSFKVSGIFASSLEEMNNMMALADMRDVRGLAGLDENQISGYEVMLSGTENIEQTYLDINGIFDFPESFGENIPIWCTPFGLQVRYPVVFDWLKAHNVIAQTVIIIMMIVLLFNMIAAVLIMVFDRIGMIGTLKTQGMTNAAIRRIFLYRAAILFAKGAFWGNIIGLALVAIQAIFHPIKLDPSGYMLSELPAHIGLGWWLLLNVGVLAATILVMVLPSAVVAKIKPEQSLKYKQ